MRTLLQEVSTSASPESVIDRLAGLPGVMLLRSGILDGERGRYSILGAKPFLTMQAWGSRCETASGGTVTVHEANPWQLLESRLAGFSREDEETCAFPLGGCFGYWGYDLKNFAEPVLPRSKSNDLLLPDCWLGFYDSLVVFDHVTGGAWIVSTGLLADGARDPGRAASQMAFWKSLLARAVRDDCDGTLSVDGTPTQPVISNLSRDEFIERVERAQALIRAGAIYQVNLSRRLTAPCPLTGWQLFRTLAVVSPAPYAAYLDCGDFQVVSSSPEVFLKMDGREICTRPIKGTRPRSSDPVRDDSLERELKSSPKEMAELIMITDLMRNDLGRVCEFGSVSVPELFRVERYAHVRHLVSTVKGMLRPEVTHNSALTACFPGGSITGAPKIQAMKVIEELETVSRGVYTGALGYLGFNRRSQLSIAIRTAVVQGGLAHFHTGAGIVADSHPAEEYDETTAKAGGFLEALGIEPGAGRKIESPTVAETAVERSR